MAIITWRKDLRKQKGKSLPKKLGKEDSRVEKINNIFYEAKNENIFQKNI